MPIRLISATLNPGPGGSDGAGRADPDSGRGQQLGDVGAEVARTGILPVINTGLAGLEPGTGQVGAGLVCPPLNIFPEALTALATS